MARYPQTALDYATLVLKDRFVQGEPAIAGHAESALVYVNKVLKGPFPLFEKKLLQWRDRKAVLQYVKAVKKWEKQAKKAGNT